MALVAQTLLLSLKKSISMIWLYRILFVPAFVLMFPYYAMRMLRRGGYAKDFSHRFGLMPKLPPKTKEKKRIWLQAVSVGEVDAVMPLVRKLNATEKYEVVITTTTSTAYALLNNKYANDCFVKAIFPIDFFLFSILAWNKIQPDIALLMEGEVWPEHLHQAKKRNVPTMLVNARLSDRSFGRYVKVAMLARRLFNKFAKICVSNDADLKRFAKLGIDNQKLYLTGNIKFDTPASSVSEDEKNAIRAELGFDEKSFVLLGSSTWSGEEKMLVRAMENLRAKGLDCRLLLIPRHAERRNEVIPEIQNHKHCVRTQQKQADAGTLIYLADTTGELRMLTSVADLVFVGKSLFNHDGGQSPIDAAAAGVAIVYGNNMTNFKLICKSLEKAGASRRVLNEAEALAQIELLALSPKERKLMAECAKKWHSENAGATDKTIAQILNI